MHRIRKIVVKENLLYDLPENLFTRTLLKCEKPQDSIKFMQYVGEFNRIEKKYNELKDIKGKLSPHSLPKVEKLCLELSKMKEHICFNTDKDTLMK